MISAKRLGAFSQHFLTFTGLSFMAASATAFFLSGADSILLTKSMFAGGLLKAVYVGLVVATVLLGRDVHLNRKREK